MFDYSSLLSMVLHTGCLVLLFLGLVQAAGKRFRPRGWLWTLLAAAIFYGLHQWEERTVLNEPVPTEAVLRWSEVVKNTPEWDSFAMILANGDLKYRDLLAIQKAREERLDAEEAAARAKENQERAAQRDADMQELRTRAVEHRQATNGDIREESKRDGVAEHVTRTTSDVSGMTGCPACNVSRDD
jgi:hypothetical protein